jgi:hypothetical protein
MLSIIKYKIGTSNVCLNNMSLLTKEPAATGLIKELESQLFEPLKAGSCHEHHLPREVTCLQQNCPCH